jgi:adenosylhomocysteine nucleosidase
VGSDRDHDERVSRSPADGDLIVLKLLVITPMKEEKELFSQRCAESGYRSLEIDIGRPSALSFPGLNLTLAWGGTGKVQFAVQTQHLLESGIQPDLVICAGAGGALVDHLKVGDVVVGTSTIEHDFREGFIDIPRPKFDVDPVVVESLSQVRVTGFGFQVDFGTVASGDEDIVSQARRTELHDTTGAIAVGWEGAGGARACHFNGIDFVEIRGITDAADEGAAADFRQNLGVAMDNIAQFIIAWITHDERS